MKTATQQIADDLNEQLVAIEQQEKRWTAMSTEEKLAEINRRTMATQWEIEADARPVEKVIALEERRMRKLKEFYRSQARSKQETEIHFGGATPRPPIRNYFDDLKAMQEGVRLATEAREGGDKNWQRFLRPMPTAYARLKDIDEWRREDAEQGVDFNDAEFFLSQSHIGEEWTHFKQHQYQVQRLFEPGDQLHIKLIHARDEWVFVENGKERRKKKTQDAWPTYEELMDSAYLSQLQQWEREGWNIFICMAVFDPAKVQAALEHNAAVDWKHRLPRRTAANIMTADGKPVVRTLYVDCDADGELSWVKVHDAVLAGTIPPPTIVVQSSVSSEGKKKFQFMWAVKDFTLEQQEELNSSLQLLFGGDIKAKDSVRVLRLAGFANQKYEAKPIATIVESSYAPRYAPDRFKILEGVQATKHGERPKASSAYIEWACSQIEANAEQAEFGLGDSRPYLGRGFIYIQDECPNADAHTDGNEAGSYLIVLPSGARVFKCHHSHCADLNWEWFKEHLNALAGGGLDWTDKKTLILSEAEVCKIQEVATQLEKAGTLSDSEEPTDDTDAENGDPEMEAATIQAAATPMPAVEISAVSESDLFPADELTETAVTETEVEKDTQSEPEIASEGTTDEGEAEDETKCGRDYYETFAGIILGLEELDTTPVCGAQTFQVFYSKKYIYAVFEAAGMWMKWTGSVWAPAAAQIEMRKAMHRLHRILPKYIAPLFKDNADKQKVINALAAKFKVPNFIDNVCKVLETELYKMFTDFDRKPHLFNFRNGTMDLNTLILGPHNPDDLLTKRISINYNAEAKCPVWSQFISNCFPFTEEEDYFDRWSGYCMTGDATEKAAPFLYGPHDCGKTTIADVITDILGPYAKVASWDSFKSAKNGEVRNDLADWHGSRFVVCDEGDKRMVMDENTFKKVTGAGGKLKVRFFYKDYFEMPINFKIMFLTNFRPVFKDQDPATWSRIHPLRMTNSFPLGHPGRIMDLKRKVRSEREGIVARMVRGLKKYRVAGGLNITQRMVKEKMEYMAHSDVQAEFFAYRTIERADTEVEFNALHHAHCQWSREIQETEMTRAEFRDSVLRRGYKVDWKATPLGRAEYAFGIALGTATR